MVEHTKESKKKKVTKKCQAGKKMCYYIKAEWTESVQLWEKKIQRGSD